MYKIGFVKPGEPTIRATNEPWSETTDVQVLNKAMKGLGTDEGPIIEVLTRRTNKQRQLIKEAYTKELNKDLFKELKSELGGNFEDLILGLMRTPLDFLCAELNRGISNGDLNAVTEILVTRNNVELKQIVQAYEASYKRPLVEHLCDKTKGEYRRLATLIVTGTRSPPGKVTEERAAELVEALYNAGEKKLGTDESEFVKIFGHESYEQLSLVCQGYRTKTGRTIEQALKGELSGDLLDLMLGIVECIQNPVIYYAKQLNKAMKGMGTDNKTLIRIIVSRSEIDLNDIKREYEKLFGKTLESHVRSETSGDFEKGLLNLIRGNSEAK